MTDKLPRIFARVRKLRDPSVDSAMAAALPTADPLAARQIVLTLMERGRTHGTAALVTQFDRAADELRDATAEK